MTDASFLFQQFSEGERTQIGPVEDYVLEALPSGDYECVDLSSLPLKNEKGKSVAGSIVWFPAGQLAAVRKISFTILADSQDCTFYLLRIAPGMSFRLNGPGHSVRNLTKHRFGMSLRMGGDAGKSPGCRVIVGEYSFCAGSEAFLLNTTLTIKKSSLWSNYILVQGSNQHGIIDLDHRALIKYPRNYITLEPRAWIGRRAILCAGAHIGAGAIVGTGALVANKVPSAVIVGGNPARVIKRNRTWAHSLDHITKIEQRMIDQYINVPVQPSTTSKMQLAARSVWAKAMAAGIAGAAIFEGFLELTEGIY